MTTDGVGSIDDTREAVVIAAWGLVGFGVYTIICQALGWIDIRLLPVLAIYVGLATVNVVLARTRRDWARDAGAAWTYEALHAVALTVLLYLHGGISLGIYLMVYGFLIVHTEVLRPDASVFVTANVCALCYALLAGLERHGWIVMPSGPFVAMSLDRYLLFTSFAVLAFNFLALYANRHGRQLHRLATRLRDRTDQLQRANERLASVASALEAKQVEVRTFVYAVTHDLKGPLGAIGLRADLLQEGARERLTADEQEHLDQILHASDRTQDMIRDLLEMFRVTSLEEPATWVDLHDVVCRSVDVLRAQIEAKRITIDVGTMPRVWAHARKLEHLLVNLIGNAVKYVPARGGHITVRASGRGTDTIVSVRDDGVGIDPIYHRRIFEAFGRAPASAQIVDGAVVSGSGIGLAVVQQIAEAHDGEAWVESAPGRGATFHVRLALVPRTETFPSPRHDVVPDADHERTHA